MLDGTATKLSRRFCFEDEFAEDSDATGCEKDQERDPILKGHAPPEQGQKSTRIAGIKSGGVGGVNDLMVGRRGFGRKRASRI